MNTTVYGTTPLTDNRLLYLTLLFAYLVWVGVVVRRDAVRHCDAVQAKAGS